MTRILLAIALLASPAVAQDLTTAGCSPDPPMFSEITRCIDAVVFETEPPTAAQELLDLYRQRIANLERQITVYQLNDAEQSKIIASQQETIKAWETRASGKMTKGQWATLLLAIVGSVGAVVGAAQ